LRDRRPAAGPDRRPDRRGRAPSRGCLSRQEAEADAQSAGATGRADAELHVQCLRRLARLDRPRPRAAARCPAAMIEANRTMYTDKAKVVPSIEKATDKPKEA